MSYFSKSVSGATAQRNINDIRAAVHHAEDNMRIPMAPKIKNLKAKFKSAPRERTLTIAEMARIAWYASHNRDLFRFVALQFATAARPGGGTEIRSRHAIQSRHRFDRPAPRCVTAD